MKTKVLFLFTLLTINLFSQTNSVHHKAKQNVENNTKVTVSDFKNNYNHQPVLTYLLDETFGSGANTTAPVIAPQYCWNNQPFPLGQPCGNNAIVGFPNVSCLSLGFNSSTIEDNQYDVTSVINPNNCNWFDYRDHSSNSTNPTGRFLAINIGSAAGNYGVLYSKQLIDVIPNQPVKIELYAANLLKVGVVGGDPDLLIELVDPFNTVVSSPQY